MSGQTTCSSNPVRASDLSSVCSTDSPNTHIHTVWERGKGSGGVGEGRREREEREGGEKESFFSLVWLR